MHPQLTTIYGGFEQSESRLGPITINHIMFCMTFPAERCMKCDVYLLHIVIKPATATTLVVAESVSDSSIDGPKRSFLSIELREHCLLCTLHWELSSGFTAAALPAKRAIKANKDQIRGALRRPQGEFRRPVQMINVQWT